jgi:hypothetical protein
MPSTLKGHDSARTLHAVGRQEPDFEAHSAVRDDGGGASRSTDPAAGTSSATDVSLREYFTALLKAERDRVDDRFDSMQAAVDAAFDSSQRAIKVTNEAMERRFEGVNEFRETLSDQARSFVTKDVLDSMLDKLQSADDQNQKDIDALEKKFDKREGQEEGSKLTIGTLVTVITLGVGVIGLLIVVAGVVLK